ncbi:cytochrome b5 domain-containing protein [Candidatus Nomurabacteria bacterium]|nr:cytochrome b5 domain-containing protein [Candidatus Nomurabacteria bacterium]
MQVIQARLVSIIIGLTLVLSTGSLVYLNKKPVVLLIENEIPVVETSNKTEPVAENKTQTAPAPTKTTTTPTKTTTTPTPTKTEPSTTSGITMAQIAKHNSRESCWSVINGNVYDLTSWIPNHPGGEKRILNICGIDGSKDYSGAHRDEQKPAKYLSGFKIGKLAT